MISNKIKSLMTSEDQRCYVWHHLKHNHAAGDSVTATVKLPKTAAHAGFPVGYHVSVTPRQPGSVHVSKQTAHSFEVTLTSLDATPLAASAFSVMVIG